MLVPFLMSSYKTLISFPAAATSWENECLEDLDGEGDAGVISISGNSLHAPPVPGSSSGTSHSSCMVVVPVLVAWDEGWYGLKLWLAWWEEGRIMPELCGE